MPDLVDRTDPALADLLENLVFTLEDFFDWECHLVRSMVRGLEPVRSCAGVDAEGTLADEVILAWALGDTTLVVSPPDWFSKPLPVPYSGRASCRLAVEPSGDGASRETSGPGLSASSLGALNRIRSGRRSPVRASRMRPPAHRLRRP